MDHTDAQRELVRGHPDYARLAAMIATDHLAEHLLLTAASSCRSLLLNLGDHVSTGLHAGQALEHLSKAVLASIDPAELALPRRTDARAFYTGQGHPDLMLLGDAHSENGPSAVKKAYRLAGVAAPTAGGLQLVFNARNAAAHMGWGDDRVADPAALAFPLLAEPLLTHLGHDWGSLLDDPALALAADALADDHLHRAKALAKCARAERQWQLLQSVVPPEVLTQLASTPTEPPSTADEHVLRPCPTGGHLTWFQVEWARAEDQGEPGEGETTETQEAWLSELACPLCGLEFEGSDLDSLGLHEVVGSRVVDI